MAHANEGKGTIVTRGDLIAAVDVSSDGESEAVKCRMMGQVRMRALLMMKRPPRSDGPVIGKRECAPC